MLKGGAPLYYVFLSTGDPINELSAKYDKEKRPLLAQLGSHKEEGFGRSPTPVENCVAHSAGKVQALERGLSSAERVGFWQRKGGFRIEKWLF